MAIIKSELIDAQIENVAALPTIKPKGKMVHLTTDNSFWISDGTNWRPRDKYLIQDFTNIGTIGTAAQQAAGHIYDLDEGGTDTAYYKFAGAAGAGLETDESAAAYTLTNTNVVLCDGTGIKKNIYGSALGAYFNQSAYFDQATLWDGAANDISWMGWVWPADGQPAGIRYIVERANDANNYIRLALSTTGYFYVEGKTNSSAWTTVYSVMPLTNGAQTVPVFVCFSKDATNGVSLWINGCLEGQDTGAAAKAAFSVTTGSATIGGLAAHTAGTLYEGTMDMVRFRSYALTQRMVDMGWAVRYTIPSYFADYNFHLKGLLKDSVTDDPRQYVIHSSKEICRKIGLSTTSYIYMDNSDLDSAKYFRLESVK